MLVDEVLDGQRPQPGIAAGPGHWTAKAVAHFALQQADAILGSAGLEGSVVLARVVDWQAGTADPTMWGFELGSVVVEEDGVTVPSTSSSTTELNNFALTGLYSVPESSVWELVREQLDRTASLEEQGVAVEDPRWLPPFFTDSAQSLDDVSTHVEEVLLDLQGRHPHVFLECQVGGTWVFGELRPGQSAELLNEVSRPFKRGAIEPDLIIVRAPAPKCRTQPGVPMSNLSKEGSQSARENASLPHVHPVTAKHLCITVGTHPAPALQIVKELFRARP